MANILAYIGGILVAFQIVGQIGYASSFIVLPLALPIKPLLRRMTGASGFAHQLGWGTLWFLTVIVFLIVAAALSPIMLIYFFIGQPLIIINVLLNVLYRTSILPWKDFFFSLLHLQLKLQKIESKLTDDEIWAKVTSKEVPFLAFIGLLCITASFILRLID